MDSKRAKVQEEKKEEVFLGGPALELVSQFLPVNEARWWYKDPSRTLI